MTAVLAALGPRWDGPVVAAIEGGGQLRVARRCADLADLLSAAAAGHGSVALVGADLRGLTLSAMADLAQLGVAVVGVSPPGDDAAEARLWQLGVAAVVPADASPDDLAAALLGAAPGSGSGGGPGSHTGSYAGPLGPSGRAVAPRRPSGADGVDPLGPVDPGALEQPEPGRILVVWGPAGAPGRTTVAVNLAAELALRGREVLLVDADTYGGCVAQTLSVLDEAPGLVAAARAAETGALDLFALARLALVIGPRLRVLTGIPRAERWPEIRGPALERVLTVGRSLASHVVVDIGSCLEDDEELSYDTQAPRRNQAALAALAVADELVVVGGCDPVALQRLVRGLQDLGSIRSPRPVVVVNRLRAGPIGAGPGRLVTDALSRFAGVTEAHLVPDDPAAVDAAMLAGRSLAEVAPGSAARAAIGALAGRLAGASDPLPGARHTARRGRVRRRG